MPTELSFLSTVISDDNAHRLLYAGKLLTSGQG